MSVVVYQCDACSREIEIVHHEHGLDTINRCTITDKCKGSLHLTTERSTGVIGKSVIDEDGLDNYQSRNILYVHEQQLSSSSWKIVHKLNTSPTIHAYIDRVELDESVTRVLLDPDDYVVTYVDPDNTTVEFATTTTGIVHAVSRMSTSPSIQAIQQDIEYQQISANTIVTIGIRVNENEQQTVIGMNFVSPSTSETTNVDVDFTAHKFDETIALFDTPWKNIDIINLKGAIYKLYSVRISEIISSNNIEDGSPFSFSDGEDFMILISNPPYDNVIDAENTAIYLPGSVVSVGTSANSRVDGTELSIDNTQSIVYHPSIKIIKNIFE